MNESLKQYEWDRSYANHDNFIFYPKEETVKFLNRFVRKRLGLNKFIDILPFEKEVRALDFGCGIGRITILCKEFGMNSFGIDISENAVHTAHELAEYFNFSEIKDNFIVSNSSNIPFQDNFFDVTISEAVLDSMSFKLAKKVIKEIERVTKTYFFVSLISGNNSDYYREFSGEVEIDTEHEKGTIQTFYNFSRIQELIGETNFKIKWCRLIQEEGIIDKYYHSRYYLVLEKK